MESSMMMSTKPVVGLVKQVTVAQGGNHTADGDLESFGAISRINSLQLFML